MTTGRFPGPLICSFTRHVSHIVILHSSLLLSGPVPNTMRYEARLQAHSPHSKLDMSSQVEPTLGPGGQSTPTSFHHANAAMSMVSRRAATVSRTRSKDGDTRPEQCPGSKNTMGRKSDRWGSAQVLGRQLSHTTADSVQLSAESRHHRASLSSSTSVLFPPLPSWGPPVSTSRIRYTAYRVSAFFLSLAFLAVIVLGALFTSIPTACSRLFYRCSGRDPDMTRPFYEEELRRTQERRAEEKEWRLMRMRHGLSRTQKNVRPFPPDMEPDPLVCDLNYYARRVGLDVEEYDVETEDGFIISLYHVYDPRDRAVRGNAGGHGDQCPKFPVLLIHGLLQSAGAYCVNDDDSLAFYLCKAGFDVWIGNNRCGFKPRHVTLEYDDPRLWCWNIRHMGVMDLHALTTRVVGITGFEKIGLVCHSQGTTQAFVALAKEQRPELGEKLTVFCALAPAAYAGPLIEKMYFKFMHAISPAMFRLMFGIHAFIPFMMTMHRALHPRIYGWLGYKVFSFLFDWTDERWDRNLRDRMFQFAPVYVSAESMRWWLGREGFSRHKCILSTKEVVRAEEKVEKEIEGIRHDDGEMVQGMEKRSFACAVEACRRKPRGATAWYNDQAPPLALWVAGSDDLVDGRKLLRRFERGREPYVSVVHSKVIPEYEHLDVIWAMDAVDKVFVEVKEVLWKTCNVRNECRVPAGCEAVEEWMVPPIDSDGDQSQSNSSDE